MKASPAPLVRPLHEGDAPAFRALRLRALKEDPAPFMTTYEEDEARPLADVAARLAASSPGTGVLGAFRGDTLIGSVGFSRHAAAKARHRVLLWGMYVAPEERRHSVGRALLLQVVALLRAVEDVEQLELTVVSREQAARSLYLAVGFERQGTARHAMKVGREYLDEDTLVLWLPRGSSGPVHPLPEGLPVPVDDGAARRLVGAALPDGILSSSVGGGLRLASMQGRTVVYVYPRTARPNEAIAASFSAIPGARGCTSEACAFRDHAAEVASAGARLVGLSAQSADDQIEAAKRLHLPFPLLSDHTLRFARAMGLPTFEHEGKTYLRRLTLVVDDGKITHVFYPVFPPDRHPGEVVSWLRAHPR
ncbi:MAG TPA: GNAT family N-acetyltransferase [Polyangiaceae bacterium]|jgi:peroxiredoxin/RimJ/RimL family protein N-acetyltransferase